MPYEYVPDNSEFSSGGSVEDSTPAGDLGRRFSGAVDRTEGSLWGLAEGVFGDTAAGRYARDARIDNELDADTSYRKVDEAGGPRSFREVRGLGDFGRYTAGLAVDSAPALLGIGAAGLVGGVPGALAVGTALGTGDVLDNQRDQAGYTNMATALPLGLAYGAADSLLGIGGMVARRSLGTGIRALDRAGVDLLDGAKGFGGAAARTGVSMTKTGAVESGSETFQTGMNQLGRMSVDPTESFYNERSAQDFEESAIGGGLLGGLVGGVAGGWRRSPGFRENEQRDLLAGRQAESERVAGLAPPGYQFTGPAPEPLGPLLPEQTGPFMPPNYVTPEQQALNQRQANIEERKQQLQQQVDERKQQIVEATQEINGFLGLSSEKWTAQHALYRQLDQLAQTGAISQGDFVTQVAAIHGEKPIDLPGVRKFVAEASKRAKEQAPTPQVPGTPAAQVPSAAPATPEDARAQEAVAAKLMFANQELGTDSPKMGAAQSLITELADLRNAGTITPAQYTEHKAMLAGKTPTDPTTVRRFIRDTLKAQPTAAEIEQQADTDNAPKGTPTNNNTPAASAAPAARAPSGVTSTQSAQPVTGQGAGGTQPTQTAPIAPRVHRIGPAAPAVVVSPADQAKAEKAEKAAKVAKLTALRAERKKLVPVVNAAGMVDTTAEAEVGDLGGLDPQSEAAKRVAKIDLEIADLIPPAPELRAQVAGLLAKELNPNAGKRAIEALDKFKRRLKLLTGLELDGEGGVIQPETPMTISDVARAEGVSTNAISKQFMQMGLTRLHIDRLVASPMADGSITDDEVVGDDTQMASGMEDRNTGSDDYVASDKSIDETGASIHTSLAKAAGDNLVEVGGVAPTLAQRQAEKEANKLLATLEAEKDKPPTAEDLAFEAKRREAATQRRMEAMAQWATTQAGINATKDWDFHRTAGSPRFAELTDKQQLHWLEAIFNLSEEQENDSNHINGLQRAYAEQNLADVPATGTPGPQADVAGVESAAQGDSGPGTDRGPAATKPAVVVKKRRVAVLPQGTAKVALNNDVMGPGAAEAAAVNRDVLGGPAQDPLNERDGVTTHRWGSVTPGKMSVQEVQSTINGVLGAVLRRNPIQVMDAPTGATPGVTGVPKGGVLPDGTVVIYASAAESRADVIQTIFHELFHRGIKRAFAGNREYIKFMLDVSAANPEVQAAAQEWKDSQDGQDKFKEFTEGGALIGDRKANYEALAVEEALAVMAERLRADGALGTKPGKSLVRALAAVFSKLADVFGLRDLAQRIRRMTYNELEQFVSETVDNSAGLINFDSGSKTTGSKNATVYRQAAPIKSGNKAIDAMPGLVSDFFSAIGEKLDWVAVRSMFTEDLVNRAAKLIPSAAKYMQNMKVIQTEKTKVERDIDSVLEAFNALPAHERGTGPASVNALLKDSTMKKAWAFQPTWEGAPKNVAVDPELAARFNNPAISDAGRALIRRVFQHGHDSLKMLQDTVVSNITTEYDGLIAELTKAGDTAEAAKQTLAKAKSLKDYQSLLALRSTWPYAPLRRFGKHVVMATSQKYMDAKAAGDNKLMQELQKDGDHYFVAFAETKREARAMVAKLAGSFPADGVGTFEKLDQADSMVGGRDMLGAMGRLRKLVRESTDANLGEKTGARVDDLMRQLHLQLLSETSARKGEIHRKNIAGAADDMMRSFATQGRATAHFIASLKTNGAIDDNLRDMQKEAGAVLGQREDKQMLLNEIMRRHSMNLEYNATPGVDKALSVSSGYLLLSNPSYFLMNATQPWMMSHPLMAARYGYVNAANELTRAYKDLLPILKLGGINEADYAKLPADVRGAVEAVADMGAIEISLGQDLGSFESNSDARLDKVAFALNKIRGAAQGVEAINRLSTAMAAYRLAKADGTTSEDKARAYAYKVITETHGDYSGFNAPRFMRTGVGRIVTQFRKFQLIQLSMFAKLLHTAFKDAKPEERLVARKALMFNLGHLAAMGGVSALPGFAAISWLVGKAIPDDDEPDDPRATLTRAVGKEWADLLWGGATQAAGVPLGGRIGAGGMLSLLPYTELEASRKGYESMFTAAAGPLLGGIAPRMVDGLGLMAGGDLWKGTEAMLPSGFANASKAARFGVQGVTQRNGDVALTSEEIGVMDLALQAIGLPTNTIQERSYLAGAKFKAETFYKERTTDLKRAYADAYNAGSGTGEVIADWNALQATRVELGFTRQPLSELVKSPQERQKRETSVVGGVQSRQSSAGFLANLRQ